MASVYGQEEFGEHCYKPESAAATFLHFCQHSQSLLSRPSFLHSQRFVGILIALFAGPYSNGTVWCSLYSLAFYEQLAVRLEVFLVDDL